MRLRSLVLGSITVSTPRTIVFTVTINSGVRASVKVAVGSRGLISLLPLQRAGATPPAVPAPGSGHRGGGCGRSRSGSAPRRCAER